MNKLTLLAAVIVFGALNANVVKAELLTEEHHLGQGQLGSEADTNTPDLSEKDPYDAQ